MTDLLFIAGMHRSHTSAFAGAALLLQGGPAGALIGPAMSNRKGHFEAVSVVGANRDLLSARRRVWYDCRPVADIGDVARGAEIKRLAELLRSEFGNASLAIIKDPRLSLFADTWIAAARQAGFRPRLVILRRAPAASAASVCRRDGLEFRYAVAVWLRYMLDVERLSRGTPRLFVDSGRLLADPMAVLTETGEKLALSWARSPRAAREDLEAFVEKSPTGPVPTEECDLLEMAGRVMTLLQEPDRPEAAEGLARIAAQFGALSPALYSDMVLRELGQCLPDRWELASVRADLARTATALRDAEREIERLKSGLPQAHNHSRALPFGKRTDWSER